MKLRFKQKLLKYTKDARTGLAVEVLTLKLVDHETMVGISED